MNQKITKKEMSRVIVQALFNLDYVPHEDSASNPLKMHINGLSRQKKAHLVKSYEQALVVLNQRNA